MHRFLSAALLAASALSSAVLAADPSARVLALPIQRRTPRADTVLSPRRRFGRNKQTVSAALMNTDFNLYYSINVTIGTPPQQLYLDIDTGSSDIWVFAPGACERGLEIAGDTTETCDSGSYNATASSTSKQLTQLDDFTIQYGDGSAVIGNYYTDTFSVSNATVTDMTLALAVTSDDNNIGILGIGFAANEAGASYGTYETFPTLVDQLQAQGVISARAYSLYLDDKESATGSILFGGIDTAKYAGELISTPIVPDYFNYTYGNNLSFSVGLSSISISTPDGGDLLMEDYGALPAPALLDSGTSLTYIPDDMYTQLASYFNTRDDYIYGTIVDCDIQPSDGTLNFQFGGNTDHTIAVPFGELAIPYTYNGTQLTFEDGTPGCFFGLQPSSDYSIILGDTFLRSAYVVYDMDNRQIGLAQARYNVSESNIVEIASGATSIPGATISAAVPIPTSNYYDTYDYGTDTYSYEDYSTSYNLGPLPTPTPGASSLDAVPTTISKLAFATGASNITATTGFAPRVSATSRSTSTNGAFPMITPAVGLMGLAVGALAAF